MTEGTLTIDLAGDRREISRTEALSFGRAGDILVDESNPYLHRMVGRFFWRAGRWWIENLGSFVELDVAAVTGDLIHLAAHGPYDLPVVAPLAGPDFRVLFTSGGVSYQLSGTMEGPAPDPASVPGGDDVARGVIRLSGPERQLLEALAGPRLADPGLGPDALPGPDELASQLGWPSSTLERRLDYLCSRLTRSGVRGLQRRPGRSAAERRWRLAEHAVASQLVARAGSGPVPQM